MTKRLVELSTIQGSTDNISVIVVFLKDPHQISTSSWPSAVIPSPLDNMETAYDNSNGATFNNSNEVSALQYWLKSSPKNLNTFFIIGFSRFQEVFQKSNHLHDFAMDFKNTNVTSPSPDILDNIAEYAGKALDEVAEVISKPVAEHVDFIFGNSGNNTLTPTNGKRAAAEMDDENDDIENHHDHNEEADFGPETDVDAVDEAMLSPMSPVKSYGEQDENVAHTFIDTNLKADLMSTGDLLNENNELAGADYQHLHHHHLEHNDIIEAKFDDYGYQCDDNKMLETVVEDVDDNVHQAATRKGIDFSEKKEFSFEREEFEKELDSLSDATAALSEVAANLVSQATDSFSANNLQELLDATPDQPANEMDSFIVPETELGE